MSPGGTPRSRHGYARTVSVGTIAIGFAALALAALVARSTPASAYELSIYAGTPKLAWLGVAVALLVALVVSVRARTEWVRRGALALGASAVTVIALMPLLRHYRFHGAGDSLTHLGWAGEVVAGTLEPINIFYPAVHVIAVQLNAVSGLTLERSLMLTVVIFLVAFLAFVPLVARAMTADEWTVTLAAISAWLLLPLNHVGTVMLTFPTTQALFFLPVVLFALLAFLRRPSSHDALPGGISPYAVVLALAGVGILLVHPQQAVNVLILLGTGTVLQAVVRRWRPTDPIATHRPLFVQTVILGAAFVAWTVRRERFRRAVNGAVANVFIPGFESVGAIGTRSGSLTQMGVGLEVLFVKLFLLGAIYALLSGWLVLALARNWSRSDTETRAAITYFVAALVPLTALFGFYFSTTPTLGFRQLGLLMVFSTLLGAVALASLSTQLRSWRSPVTARTVVSVFLIAALVLSAVTVFSSPFIYKTSNHVSDQAWDGHEFALTHRGDDIPYSRITLSAHTYRYGDAILGVEKSSTIDYDGSADGRIPPSAFNSGDITDVYDGPRYFKVSQADYQRSVHLYDEFRYTRAGYQTLPNQRGLNKVSTNGAFQLYLIDGAA